MNLKVLYTFSLLSLLTISCNTDHKKQEVKFEPQNQVFNDFLSRFESLNLPISVDSVFYSEFKSDKQIYNLVDVEKYQDFINIPEAAKNCAPNKKQYETYTIGKININSETIGIMVLLELNSTCGFDAYIRKVFLITYNTKGTIIDYSEVGGNEMQWGLIKYINIKITESLIIEQKVIELIEDEKGITKKTIISTNMFSFKDGVISSLE